jgi:hypothetical protein
MEIHHKQKPWHGWREFLREYLTIVVGVLTALGAEQAVEWVRMQEAVEALRGALRTELIDSRNRWEANRIQDACVAQRLDDILAWAATSPPQAVVTHAGVPNIWFIHASAWDSAKANPASLHMSPAEHTLYAEEYDVMAGLQRDLVEERRSWVEIAALLEQGDSPEDKRALRKLAIVEKHALAQRRYNYTNIFARFDALRIPAQPLAKAHRDAADRLCAPLVTAPTRRGQGG